MAEGVKGLGRSVSVVVCLEGLLINVCLNDRHTLVERCFDHQGTTPGLFAEGGQVRAEGLSTSPPL